MKDVVFFEKYEPDASEIQKDTLRRAEGIVWLNGQWRSVRQPVEVASFAKPDTAPHHGQRYFLIAGKDPLFLGSDKLQYEYLGAVTDISKVGAYPNAEAWSFTRFAQLVVATDINYPPQASVGLGAFADLITSWGSPTITNPPRFRYVFTVGSHVIGASVDPQDGGGEDVTRYQWCKRDDAANWDYTVVENRAGFNNTPSTAGRLSGGVGFFDFGVLFAEFGVFRLELVGGAGVWQLFQIGYGPEGMTRAQDQSTAIIGRDIFYMSRSGPAVVRNGEEIEQIGEGVVRATLANQHYTGDMDPAGQFVTAPWFGGCDANRHSILWCTARSATGMQLQHYQSVDRRWSSVFLDNYQVTGLSERQEAIAPVSRGALDGFDVLATDAAGTTAYVLQFPAGPEYSRVLAVFQTEKRRHGDGQLAEVRAVRPVFRFSEGVPPVTTLRITSAYNQEFTQKVQTVVVDSTMQEDLGWWGSGKFPMVGQYFQYQFEAPAGDGSEFAESIGVEVEFEEVGK